MMNRFRIIPVIDIMNGTAVHANKGLRNEYQPIHMKFSQSSKPQDLLLFFLKNMVLLKPILLILIQSFGKNQI